MGLEQEELRKVCEEILIPLGFKRIENEYSYLYTYEYIREFSIPSIKNEELIIKPLTEHEKELLKEYWVKTPLNTYGTSFTITNTEEKRGRLRIIIEKRKKKHQRHEIYIWARLKPKRTSGYDDIRSFETELDKISIIGNESVISPDAIKKIGEYKDEYIKKFDTLFEKYLPIYKKELREESELKLQQYHEKLEYYTKTKKILRALESIN